MMYSIKKLSVIIFIGILSISIGAAAQGGNKNNTAIIYDTYNEFGSEENKLNSLVRLILSSGSGVDILNSNSYLNGTISKYKILFILYNNSSEPQDALVNDLENFKGRIVWIGKNFDKLSAHISNTRHLPYFSSQTPDYITLKNDFYKLINNENWKKRNVYLLIDNVYPFIDLNTFTKKIDFLYDNGIPFICSVMPIYENQNMDAMKRFCRVLEYAQNKGGKIILHFPVLYGENISGKEIEYKLHFSQKIYMDYGIHPIALDIPEGFLYREDSKALIHSASTVFINKDTNIGILNFKNYSIASFNLVIDKVDFKDRYIRESSNSIHNMALSVNSDMVLDNFEREVNQLLKDEFYFSDPAYLDTSSQSGKKYLNQDENSTAKSIDISSGNRKIIKITIIICILFTSIILIGIKIDTKKFFK